MLLVKKMNKVRIGVLMDSVFCPVYMFETISGLANELSIELYLLQNKSQKKGRLTKIREIIAHTGFLKSIDIAFFIIVTSFEERIVKALGYQRERFSDKELEEYKFKKTIIVNPLFSKTQISEISGPVTYDEEDVKKIKALNLDFIMIGNGSGIYTGEILKSSKHGIISLHHGDNRWNRGWPPGFWEVYYKRPSTGFSIQILNEKHDDGDVLFRGEINTFPLFILNQAQLYEYSYPFLKQVIIDFAKTGILPKKLQEAPFSYQILKVPKCTVTGAYFITTCLKFVASLLERKVLHRDMRWSVAFILTDWTTANLSKAMVITSPKGRFLADPFVIRYDDQSVIFVEDFHYSTDRGAISAIRLREDGSYEILPDVIKEEFHLSFPYIFNYKNELYMIPESNQSKTIRLYKCIHFPDIWEYQYNIMQDVSALDTLVFEHAGKWWLLSNIVPKDLENHGSQLLAFTADNPLSKDWQPHRKNPICLSAELARNGGILRDQAGDLYRVRQKQGFHRYGVAFTIAKIKRLDIDNFEEETYCEVVPKFFPDLSGTHHMHCDQGITVFDFVKEETIL